MTRCVNKNSPKSSNYLNSDVFQYGPNRSQFIWTTFARKFFTKNFKKSPNLITVVVIDGPCLPNWFVTSLFLGYALSRRLSTTPHLMNTTGR